MDSAEQHDFAKARRLVRRLSGLGEAKAPASVLPAVLVGAGLADGFWSLESPLGDVFVANNEQGISAVMLAPDVGEFGRAFRARFGRGAYPVAQPEAVARIVSRHLAGDRHMQLPLDLRGLSEFQRAVLLKALEIPRGEVRPYSWIACEIGNPRAARAVGSALARNPVPLLIPCHRVVRGDGRIGEYAFGSHAKRALLQAEGVRIEGLELLAKAGVRYYGSDTTRVFCYPTCRCGRRISEQHRVAFSSSAEANAAGYRPCRICRPAPASWGWKEPPGRA